MVLKVLLLLALLSYDLYFLEKHACEGSIWDLGCCCLDSGGRQQNKGNNNLSTMCTFI